MEAILSSSASPLTTIPTTFIFSKPTKNPSQISPPLFSSLCFPYKTPLLSNNCSSCILSFSFSSTNIASSPTKTRASTASSPITSTSLIREQRRRWLVLVESPQEQLNSEADINNYYVKTLENVLGSEQDAKMSIYDASTTKNLGFCCFIDPESARELARLPGVLSVRPDADFNSVKDYSYSEAQLHEPSSSNNRNFLLFPVGTTKRWTVRVYKPPASIVTKAQVVDYFVQILAEVLRNEQDAQMCIYDISWESSYGFCCELDDKCAQELAGISGVLSVHPDENFESHNKEKSFSGSSLVESSSTNQAINIKTKKLFITGLSFYTSEKTLREAFESFGEIIEVKIIMDKISKRSKGFAFIEYTTEEAASAALKEMNGKIINGWMITVDVAKKTPPKHSNGRPRPAA